MTNTFSEFREQFWKLVEGATHVAITAHFSPDDDSIASVLSVYTIVATKYPTKDIRILYTGEISKRHDSFYNFEKIEWVEDVASHLAGTDLLIVLDVNRYSRVSKLLPEHIATVATTIAIDHHGSSPDLFTLSCVQPEYSSNAQLIYQIFDAESLLTKELAELFLLGILGDTGNLSHIGPPQSQVFVVVKKLVEVSGVIIDEFKARYGGIPRQVIPLIQELVKNITYGSVEGWPDFQYTFIACTDVSQYSDEDISAATHIYMGQYLPKVKGYSWGFVISPRTDGTCRMSGRSLPGSVNVRDLHERLGVGGGHDRASGGYFTELDPQICISKVLEWMKSNTPLLV